MLCAMRVRNLLAGAVTLAAAGAAALGVASAGAPAAGARAGAAAAKPVVVRDPIQDASSGGLDVVRAQLGRGSDGRLRAVISLGSEITASDLRAAKGPPGSICLRMWTLTTPGGIPPDYLLCVTAGTKGKALQAGLVNEQVNALPRRIAVLAVTRPSKRSIAVRFSQSSVRRPKTIRFAAEATKAGCARLTCIDTAPEAPKTATLKLGGQEARHRPA